MTKKQNKNNDILIKKISKSYPTQCVLHNFSAVIESNKANCLFGPSGSGKTTLIRILLNLETIDDGIIQNLSGLKLSAVFQEDRLCENFSALTNVQMVIPNKDDLDKGQKLLEELGLEEKLHQKVKELSGGMKRRVALARALATDYNLLILDEPFKGLDKKRKEKTIETVNKYSHGNTVILVTHDLQEAELMNIKNYIYL